MNSQTQLAIMGATHHGCYKSAIPTVNVTNCNHIRGNCAAPIGLPAITRNTNTTSTTRNAIIAATNQNDSGCNNLDSGYIDYAASTNHEFNSRSLIVNRGNNSNYHATITVGENGRDRSGNIRHRFPEFLHYILSSAEAEGQSRIISWQPHGRCFKIHDRPMFIKHFLPNWFRQKEFASFQRQLNLYSFRRITTGPDQGGYYHHLFLRGKPFLAYSIHRTTKKSKGPRKPANPETEPKFYEMEFLPPSSLSSEQGPQFAKYSNMSNITMNKPWQQVPRDALDFVTSNPIVQQNRASSGAIDSSVTLRSLLLPIFADSSSSCATVDGPTNDNQASIKTFIMQEDECIKQALVRLEHPHCSWLFSMTPAQRAKQQELMISPLTTGTNMNMGKASSDSGVINNESSSSSIQRG